jgi:hypothetical protein
MAYEPRPDSYILELARVKSNLAEQVFHCNVSLALLQEIVLDPNYETAATALEKSNISELTTLITDGLAFMNAIVWE